MSDFDHLLRSILNNLRYNHQMINWFKNVLNEISSLVVGMIILFFSYGLPAYAVKNDVWWPFFILALFWGIFIWLLSGRGTNRERDTQKNLDNALEHVRSVFEKKQD